MRDDGHAGRTGAGPGQLFLPGRRRRGDLTVTYLTNQLPFPAHSGGQLREAQLLARAGQAPTSTSSSLPRTSGATPGTPA